MVELLRLRMTGLHVFVSAWIAAAFLMLLAEIFLQVALFPLSMHPIRRFRERRHRALDWRHIHGLILPNKSGT
jgi:hypothetical protein